MPKVNFKAKGNYTLCTTAEFMAAVKTGDPYQVDKLYFDDNTLRGLYEGGLSPLEDAIKCGHSMMVKYLLEQGLKPVDGKAILLAIEMNLADIMAILLKAYDDYKLVEQALTTAIENQRVEIVKILLTSNYYRHLLQYGYPGLKYREHTYSNRYNPFLAKIIQLENIDLLNLCIDIGLDFKDTALSEDDRGKDKFIAYQGTAILWVAAYGKNKTSQLIKLLFAQGLSIGEYKYYYTSIDHGWDDVPKYHQAVDEYNALEIAIKFNNHDAVKTLLELGARPNQTIFCSLEGASPQLLEQILPYCPSKLLEENKALAVRLLYNLQSYFINDAKKFISFRLADKCLKELSVEILIAPVKYAIDNDNIDLLKILLHSLYINEISSVYNFIIPELNMNVDMSILEYMLYKNASNSINFAKSHFSLDDEILAKSKLSMSTKIFDTYYEMFGKRDMERYRTNRTIAQLIIQLLNASPSKIVEYKFIAEILIHVSHCLKIAPGLINISGIPAHKILLPLEANKVRLWAYNNKMQKELSCCNKTFIFFKEYIPSQQVWIQYNSQSSGTNNQQILANKKNM